MDTLLCIALCSPLVGFLGLCIFSGYVGRGFTGIVACGTVLISFVGFLFLFLNHQEHTHTMTLFRWIPIKEIHANFSLTLDSLSLLMTLIITGVGFLIHGYSLGYMEHEKGFVRYFACLNFFVFSMLLLVLASNLLLLFVGWEGVGLASYLLIGFWHEKPKAAQAATKAFVINRIGDAGLLIGILLTFHLFGTTEIGEITQRAHEQFSEGAFLLTVLTLLYFWGAQGKSAQFPLHTWLPDAMEGPTPVSALIHAATMVTAGVYLVVRFQNLFILTPATLYWIGAIGAGTSLFAALTAIGQNDLKRVLAYSTVSQLGLMFLACGVGAFYAAMFHLTMHAFIKALLFLSAGNVVHMLDGETDMEKMRGLRKQFFLTHWFFLIGVLSLAGVPPLAGFFSKDLILEIVHISGFETLYFIALAASVLTGFYLTRAYCLTFLGTPQREKTTHTGDAPSTMLVPVSLLGFLSIVGGLLVVYLSQFSLFTEFFAGIGIHKREESLMSNLLFLIPTWIATSACVAAIFLAAFFYTRRKIEKPWKMLNSGFFIDTFYDRVIVSPVHACSRWMNRVAEHKFFTESLRLFVAMAQGIARRLQYVQSGQIRSYVAWMVLGAAFLLFYTILE